jgi:hypothetical protein
VTYKGRTFWSAAGLVVMAWGPHEEMRISAAAPHPRKAGFRKSSGKGKGIHWRLCLKDGRGLHVRELRGCYFLHWDHVDPSASLIQHARRDYPPGWMAGCTASGMTLGAGLGAGFGGAIGSLVGTVLGIIIGFTSGAIGLVRGPRKV